MVVRIRRSRYQVSILVDATQPYVKRSHLCLNLCPGIIRSTIQGEAVVAANYRSLTPSCAAGVGSCILQSTTLLLSSSDKVLLDGFMQFCCFVRKIWSESSPGKGCVFRSISYQELGEPGCYQPHFSAFPSAQNDRQDREISIGSSRRHRSSAPPQVYP